MEFVQSWWRPITPPPPQLASICFNSRPQTWFAVSRHIKSQWWFDIFSPAVLYQKFLLPTTFLSFSVKKILWRSFLVIFLGTPYINLKEEHDTEPWNPFHCTRRKNFTVETKMKEVADEIQTIYNQKTGLKFNLKTILGRRTWVKIYLLLRHSQTNTSPCLNMKTCNIGTNFYEELVAF